LEIDEASFGSDHPSVARDLNILAGLLAATNRPYESEELYRRALTIDEKRFGPDHPNFASSLNNLALLLRKTNRSVEVELLYRWALAIAEASFGPDHPKVAIYLNNLAEVMGDTSGLAEAEPLMRRHVDIFINFERRTGHAHPHREAALRNYADLLKAMGKSEAEVKGAISSLTGESGVRSP
jgi:tetratricopeptide (TPR) repeat protein